MKLELASVPHVKIKMVNTHVAFIAFVKVFLENFIILADFGLLYTHNFMGQWGGGARDLSQKKGLPSCQCFILINTV